MTGQNSRRPYFIRFTHQWVGGRNSDGWDKRTAEKESGSINPLPLFIYTPKESRLRFLAPKHTSRFLFWSEVAHSTKRLGDRTAASWGRRTSAHRLILCAILHIWETYFRGLLPLMRRKAYRNQHLSGCGTFYVRVSVSRCQRSTQS